MRLIHLKKKTHHHLLSRTTWSSRRRRGAKCHATAEPRRAWDAMGLKGKSMEIYGVSMVKWWIYSGFAAAKKGKGGKGGKASTDQGPVRKLEAHLAATESLSEVLYVEAWGEIGDQLAQKCVVGDVVAIQGGSFIATPAQYSTSRLHYHLHLRGALGLQVVVQKLEQDPWHGVPTVHPLVPLQALSRVKDRQQICVAVSMVENPGTVERQTKEGPAVVCNEIVQQGATRVRCAFWHEQAQELAELQPGTCVMLYQVLISKRKEEKGRAKGDETSGGDDDDDDAEMRAQRSRHMRAHESRHIRAHIWKHT